jgi:hypothetical protein
VVEGEGKEKVWQVKEEDVKSMNKGVGKDMCSGKDGG